MGCRYTLHMLRILKNQIGRLKKTSLCSRAGIKPFWQYLPKRGLVCEHANPNYGKSNNSQFPTLENISSLESLKCFKSVYLQTKHILPYIFSHLKKKEQTHTCITPPIWWWNVVSYEKIVWAGAVAQCVCLTHRRCQGSIPSTIKEKERGKKGGREEDILPFFILLNTHLGWVILTVDITGLRNAQGNRKISTIFCLWGHFQKN